MMLIFTEELWGQIRDIAFRTRLETGVSLFGTKDSERRIVKAIADPGQKATHQYAHYSGDEDHASQIFDKLRRDDPSIEWLGELHAHPPGMTWLSAGDKETVADILLGTDDTYHPDEFIAGVIQRVSGSIVIYPVRFTKTDLEGPRRAGCRIRTGNVTSNTRQDSPEGQRKHPTREVPEASALPVLGTNTIQAHPSDVRQI